QDDRDRRQPPCLEAAPGRPWQRGSLHQAAGPAPERARADVTVSPRGSLGESPYRRAADRRRGVVYDGRARRLGARCGPDRRDAGAPRMTAVSSTSRRQARSDAVTGAADPVTVEIVRNALVAAADEMSVNLGRSAYTPIIYEMKDYSVAIFD